MSMRFFNFFILVMLVGVMQIFSVFRAHFSEEKYLRSELGDLKKNFVQLRLENQLVNYHYKEFQQNVAGLLPEAINKQPFNYPLRNIASVVDRAEPLKLESASGLFERGRALYEKKDFEEASVYFKKVSIYYTESVYLPESLFMLAESYYQLQDFERSTDAIEYLVDQFPEHVLTGYSLLRLGKMYEKHDRTQDAIMAYGLIRERFQQKELVDQATTMLEGLE